ncbi:MAG: hypothetical protein HY319_28460 [Armatimonadetes bacterium]|nr:hypothetical protein [Armatimonadota bacterium]
MRSTASPELGHEPGDVLVQREPGGWIRRLRSVWLCLAGYAGVPMMLYFMVEPGWESLVTHPVFVGAAMTYVAVGVLLALAWACKGWYPGSVVVRDVQRRQLLLRRSLLGTRVITPLADLDELRAVAVAAQPPSGVPLDGVSYSIEGGVVKSFDGPHGVWVVTDRGRTIWLSDYRSRAAALQEGTRLAGALELPVRNGGLSSILVVRPGPVIEFADYPFTRDTVRGFCGMWFFLVGCFPLGCIGVLGWVTVIAYAILQVRGD